MPDALKEAATWDFYSAPGEAGFPCFRLIVENGRGVVPIYAEEFPALVELLGLLYWRSRR